LRLTIRRLAPLVLSAFLATPPLHAQQRPANRVSLEAYLDWEDVSAPQLSPDGQQVLFSRRWVDKMNDKWESSVWIMNADGSRSRSLMSGSDAQWSPDGKRIAYIAKGEPGGSQIFVKWMDGETAPTQISRLTEAPSALQWSPDGKSIAFNMSVPVRDNWRISMPQPPKGAKWTEAPKVVTKLNYRSDRIGFTDEGIRHIFLIPSDGGTARQITTGDFGASAPAFSPDGKWIAFSGLREANAENMFRKAHIYAANIETAEIKQVTHRWGTSGNPTFSPDGKMIAFMAADSVNHSAWAESKLWVMNADGSNAHLITGTLDRPISGVTWATDGSGVYFNVESEGSKNLYFATTAGQYRAVTTGKHVLTVGGAPAKSGLAVGILTTPTKPNDIVTFTVSKTGAASAFNQITNVNDDVLTGKELATTEEIWYKSKDGMKIQGWIVKPPGFDPAKKYPLMLEIHGGPQSMYNVGFSYSRQDHAAAGYVMLYTNPRGSTGYGEKFTNEIMNAYPDKDFDDLMAGVDTVVGRGYVDSKNMYVFGCSGGGVLTSWTVGHTDRFAAAAALCPVIDWISFVGQTDGASWYQNFEKPFWEDPSEYLKRSPIMYVGHVKTPTLLMTGVLDLRTPIPQIEEYYRALKMHGTPTAMIRMNNEYHGTSSTPSNFLRTQLYLRSWFDKYGAKPMGATSSDNPE
jgi:dipeptidyl aminopeptidase/acylaminoacyl peptidase